MNKMRYHLKNLSFFAEIFKQKYVRRDGMGKVIVLLSKLVLPFRMEIL